MVDVVTLVSGSTLYTQTEHFALKLLCKLKKESGYKYEVNKNYLPEFEELLGEGHNEIAAKEAFEFFESHFIYKGINERSFEDFLQYTSLRRHIRIHQENVDVLAGNTIEPKCLPYIVFGSYGVGIEDEINFLKNFEKQIQKNMIASGNTQPDDDNFWFRLMARVIDRKRFLEGCKK